MSGLLKPHHFHDLGKLTLAFVMLWAYFNFSQYLLTYAANLVEEIPYMMTRISNGWQYLALFLVLFHFVVPLLLLLSREPASGRRSGSSSSRCWLLFMRFVDIFMLVSPEFDATGGNLHMLAASTRATSSCTGSTSRRRSRSAGCGSGCSSRSCGSVRCWPLGDPYLRESLESAGEATDGARSSRRPRAHARRRVLNPRRAPATSTPTPTSSIDRQVRHLAGRVCDHHAHR